MAMTRMSLREVSLLSVLVCCRQFTPTDLRQLKNRLTSREARTIAILLTDRSAAHRRKWVSPRLRAISQELLDWEYRNRHIHSLKPVTRRSR